MEMSCHMNGRAIEIGAQIGSGRLGEVYAALADGAPVAVKVYTGYATAPDVIADAMRRSVWAGRILADMSQKSLNIAAGTDPVVVRDQGREWPALVMPRAGGIPCGDWLANRPKDREKLSILYRLLTGIAQMHRSGVAHNDVSFGNVLIGERLWLVDFDRAGDSPPPLIRDSVFYEKTGAGMAHDLRAFGILAMIMMDGRHPWSDYLPSLMIGQTGFGSRLRLPVDQTLATFLRPALECAAGLSAAKLLESWPFGDH